MALASVNSIALCALGALALLACGRIDLGSRETPDGAGGSATSIERPLPPPQISLGDAIRTEVIPGNSGSDSTITFGGEPDPDDALAGGAAAIADAGVAPDAGTPSPTPPGSSGDAGTAADSGPCEPAPSCDSETESCCAPSLVPAG